MNAARAVGALWRRELVRFFRQPSRIASAVASPLIFWAIIGSGLSSSFRLPGEAPDIAYLRFFFPGTIVLLVLFASIFGAISVIEDRQLGFLQGVQVAPIPPLAMVTGKVLGATTLAWLQGLLLLPLAPLAGVPIVWANLLAATGVLALLATALAGIGFAFAWKVDSSSGFHAVMNLLLMPMWLLSGAFFPLVGAPRWLDWAARVNPLTYGVAAFRRILDPGTAGAGPSTELPILVLVTVLFALAGLAAAVAVTARRKGASP